MREDSLGMRLRSSASGHADKFRYEAAPTATKNRTAFFNPNHKRIPIMSSKNAGKLAGKVALVTGASRGIGAAIARRLAG